MTLTDNNTTIQIAASIATTGQVLGKSIVSADGQVTLDTSPFRLALNSGVKLFIFQAATAQAEITAKSFSGVLNIELIVARGNVSVNSWVDRENDFHLTGSGRVEVGIPKGKIFQKCVKFLFIKFRCVRVPPKDLLVGSVPVLVGEFRNGAWDFKGSVNVLKFASPASTLPLTVSTIITQPSELIFALVRDGESPTLRLISPDGAAISQDQLPDNVSYEEGATEVEDPNELPSTQVLFTVANAQPGEWLAVLEGEPAAADSYFFEVLGNPDEPVVEAEEGLVLSSAANSATVSWRIRSNALETYVAIYANPEPITQTVHASAGASAVEVIEQYDGYVLAEDIEALVNGELQSVEVNTDFLPSGTYRLWIEVDDGINDPVEFYLPQPLVINRSSDFEASWTPTITVEPDYDEIHIGWSHHPSPDVAQYKVFLSEQFSISDDHIMPTAGGVAVEVTISSTNTPPGLYRVPIVGISDNYEVVVDLQVTVTN